MDELTANEREFLEAFEKNTVNNDSLTLDEKCLQAAECFKQCLKDGVSPTLLTIVIEKCLFYKKLQEQNEKEREHEKIKQEIAARYGFKQIQVSLNDEIDTDLFPWISCEAKNHILMWEKAGVVRTYQDLIRLINNEYNTHGFYTVKSAIERVVTKEQVAILNSQLFSCGYRDQWTHVKDAEVFSMLDTCGFGNMIFEHKYYLTDNRNAEPVNLERFADKKHYNRDIFDTYEDVICYLHYPDTYRPPYYKIILAY